MTKKTGAVSAARRAALARLAAIVGTGVLPDGLLEALAQTDTSAAARPVLRKALVIGNSNYRPERQSIPSSRKNAADVASALKTLGFDVREEADAGASAMRALLADFFGAVRTGGPSRPLAIFYYSGHGIQHRTGSERQTYNFVVPADVALDQRAEAIAQASINVDRELIGREPLPNEGIAVLIFDACRNDPGESGDRAGSFNQVDPPPGTIITFSTAPGRVAIAPKSADENSIYTRFLVQALRKADADISLKDFFDTVKFEVRRFMESSEEEFLRRHAQDPEVAANVRLRMTLALEKPPESVDAAEQQAWAAIERATTPAERLKLLKAFIETYRESRFMQAARAQLEQAVSSEAASRRNRLQPDTAGDAQFRDDQAKGLNGDKDASFRVARAYRDGTNGVARDTEKMVQWLRHASELKNGIASYELYLYYRDRQITREEVRYLQRARDQGYTPPLTISNQRG